MFYEMFTEKFIKGNNVSKELDYMSKGFIPLSPSILKEFEIDIDMAWHITSRKNLETLKKLQGKRKQIPTFTTGSDGISYGAQSAAEILVNLSGKSSFRGKYDFFSKLDRNGLRWLDPMGYSDLGAHNKFTVPMNAKIIKYLEDENFGDDLDRFDIPDAIKDMAGKEKAKFIKFYLDTAKKMMNKKMLELINTAIESGFKGTWNNDEVLLHDFTINYVMTIVDEGGNEMMNDADVRKTIELCEELNLVYDGEMDRQDIKEIDY